MQNLNSIVIFVSATKLLKHLDLLLYVAYVGG